MARFFLGDPHFGHLKVAKIRYPDAHESISDDSIVLHHDMTIYEQIKHTLRHGDQLWILGDISSGKSEEEKRALQLLKELKEFTGASFHILWGNHDSGSSIHRNAHKMQARFLDVFDSAHDFARMRFEGTQVLLSHYPYARSGDGPGRGEARYLEYRLPDTGLPLIHAHTHHTEPHMDAYGDWEELLEEFNGTKYQDIQQLCVSWDVRRDLTTEAHISQWIKEWKRS